MANTRQFDRIIRAAQAKLDGVQARQTWALTPREQAKLAAAGTVVAAKATRLKSSPRAERTREDVWSGAEARYRAEIKAAQIAREQLLTQAAAAKVEKKAKGWW